LPFAYHISFYHLVEKSALSGNLKALIRQVNEGPEDIQGQEEMGRGVDQESYGGGKGGLPLPEDVS